MVNKVFYILAFLVLLDISFSESYIVPSFNDYKVRFNKYYFNLEEESKAINTYGANAKVVMRQNLNFDFNNTLFKSQMWEESDKNSTDFERVGLFGFKLTPMARMGGPLTYPPTTLVNLNYTAQGLVTRVISQGYCGSCWAFAALGSLEGQYRKKTGNLLALSAQCLIDCNRDTSFGNWGCIGGNMNIAYGFIQAQGVTSASIYRYRAIDTQACLYNTSSSITAITNFYQVPSNDEEMLKAALAAVGPIAVAVDASLATFLTYSSGIYDDPLCIGIPNHAVLLTGFGVENNVPYWLVKNSWGTGWGEFGYMKIKRNAGNLCNIAMFPVYPVI